MPGCRLSLSLFLSPGTGNQGVGRGGGWSSLQPLAADRAAGGSSSCQPCGFPAAVPARVPASSRGVFRLRAPPSHPGRAQLSDESAAAGSLGHLLRDAP